MFELLEEESSMKKLRPSDDSSKKAKINVVKVGGEDLYRADEEVSPVSEEVGVEEWDGEEENDSGFEEINQPERLWRGGEHEPEGDPEEWIDRVADEVEEDKFQRSKANLTPA